MQWKQTCTNTKNGPSFVSQTTNLTGRHYTQHQPPEAVTTKPQSCLSPIQSYLRSYLERACANLPYIARLPDKDWQWFPLWKPSYPTGLAELHLCWQGHNDSLVIAHPLFWLVARIHFNRGERYAAISSQSLAKIERGPCWMAGMKGHTQ